MVGTVCLGSLEMVTMINKYVHYSTDEIVFRKIIIENEIEMFSLQEGGQRCTHRSF
jgi:hypothetical protein